MHACSSHHVPELLDDTDRQQRMYAHGSACMHEMLSVARCRQQTPPCRADHVQEPLGDQGEDQGFEMKAPDRECVRAVQIRSMVAARRRSVSPPPLTVFKWGLRASVGPRRAALCLGVKPPALSSLLTQDTHSLQPTLAIATAGRSAPCKWHNLQIFLTERDVMPIWVPEKMRELGSSILRLPFACTSKLNRQNTAVGPIKGHCQAPPASIVPSLLSLHSQRWLLGSGHATSWLCPDFFCLIWSSSP